MKSSTDGSSSTDAQPLNQRKSGRSQRRAERMAATAATSPDNDNNDNKHDDDLSSQQPRKGPSYEIERRIAESIAQRTISNKNAAEKFSSHDYSPEEEVVGTYECKNTTQRKFLRTIC